MNIKEITKSTDEGIDALVELLHQQMIAIGSEKFKPVILNSIQNALKNESRARFFVLYEQENPVGMAFINVGSGVESEGDYIWLNEIHVVEAYRKRGLGTFLMEHIVEWAKMNNCKKIFGVVSPDNIASENLFRSKGFLVSDMKWIDLSV